jgi:hypothetical protein
LVKKNANWLKSHNCDHNIDPGFANSRSETSAVYEVSKKNGLIFAAFLTAIHVQKLAA